MNLNLIPKIIHQTWKTEVVPAHWESSHQGWKNYEKEGWTYYLWTDRDNRELIRTNFPWFLSKYDSYKHGIQKADAIRYFILYKYGGVYTDLDIEPKNTFKEFYELYKIHNVCIPFSREGNTSGKQKFSNCFMMSKPRSDFWPVVWDLLYHPFKINPWKKPLTILHHFNIIFTTGPGIISDAVNIYRKKGKDIAIIPNHLVQPGTQDTLPPFTRPEAVVTVLKGESWNKSDSKLIGGLRKIANNIPWILLFMIIFLIISIILFILLKKCKKGKKHCEMKRGGKRKN
jgi:mannosyltransferase OCH1-like enzyme